VFMSGKLRFAASASVGRHDVLQGIATGPLKVAGSCGSNEAGVIWSAWLKK
jgi:hypothetical protein